MNHNKREASSRVAARSEGGAEQPAPQAGARTRIPVGCGDLRGELLILENLIECHGHRLTGAQFLARAGSSPNDDWKSIVRVELPGGALGCTLGRLLGLGVKPEASGHEPAGPLPGAEQRRGTRAKRPRCASPEDRPNADRGPAALGALASMRAHLAHTLLGYRPGDPTAPPPLAKLPPAREGTQIIDLRLWSGEALRREAAATVTWDPQVELMDPPPGIPEDRVAYFTGHVPPGGPRKAPAAPRLAGKPPAAPGKPGGKAAKRAQGGSGRQADATPPQPPAALALSTLQALGAFLDGKRDTAPWEELAGAAKGPGIPPTAAGNEVDLRGLWQATERYGGYDAATAAKKWSAIASAQGLNLKRYTSGAHKMKTVYARFLLPYELHRRGANADAALAAARPALEQEQAQGSESEGPAATEPARSEGPAATEPAESKGPAATEPARSVAEAKAGPGGSSEAAQRPTAPASGAAAIGAAGGRPGGGGTAGMAGEMGTGVAGLARRMLSRISDRPGGG